MEGANNKMSSGNVVVRMWKL